MTRPKTNKKGRTPPMPFNGDSPGVPDDIIWDDDNPPELFNCSDHIVHLSNCSGDCGSYVPTELRVNLINESLAWIRAGMFFRGVPSFMVQQVSGIPVELFDIEIKCAVLLDMVQELTDMSDDEMETKLRERKLAIMQRMREQSEAEVRRKRAEQALGIIPQPKRIIGPDGKPL